MLNNEEQIRKGELLVDSKRGFSDCNNFVSVVFLRVKAVLKRTHDCGWLRSVMISAQVVETLIIVLEKSPLSLRTAITLDLDWAHLLTTSVCSLFQLRVPTQQWRVLRQLSRNISTDWNRAGTVSLSWACLLCREYGLCTTRRREKAGSQGQWTLEKVPLRHAFFFFLFFFFIYNNLWSPLGIKVLDRCVKQRKTGVVEVCGTNFTVTPLKSTKFPFSVFFREWISEPSCFITLL